MSTNGMRELLKYLHGKREHTGTKDSGRPKFRQQAMGTEKAESIAGTRHREPNCRASDTLSQPIDALTYQVGQPSSFAFAPGTP